MQGHRFNDDLLANPGDVDVFERAYPSLSHVFVFPELVDVFGKYDQPANRSKRRSRRAGYAALALGTFALLAASLELALHHSEVAHAHADSFRWASAVAAACGVLSVLIGSWGVLSGKAKAQWLQDRFMTERLRQFQFQYVARQLPAVQQSLASDSAREDYIAERSRRLAEFLLTLETKERGFLGGIEESSESHTWLLPELDASSIEGKEEELERVFAAYRTLRFQHQYQYAHFKLHDPGSGLSGLVRKAKLVSATSFALVLALFVLHVFASVALAVPQLQLHELASKPAIPILAMWCAIGALGVRVFAEGLSLEHELERYRSYGKAVKDAMERFDSARSVRSKVDAMQDMERLSYHEMLSFLRTAKDARFVL